MDSLFNNVEPAIYIRYRHDVVVHGLPLVVSNVHITTPVVFHHGYVCQVVSSDEEYHALQTALYSFHIRSSNSSKYSGVLCKMVPKGRLC